MRSQCAGGCAHAVSALRPPGMVSSAHVPLTSREGAEAACWNAGRGGGGGETWGRELPGLGWAAHVPRHAAGAGGVPQLQGLWAVTALLLPHCAAVQRHPHHIAGHNAMEECQVAWMHALCMRACVCMCVCGGGGGGFVGQHLTTSGCGSQGAGLVQGATATSLALERLLPSDSWGWFKHEGGADRHGDSRGWEGVKRAGTSGTWGGIGRGTRRGPA